MNLARHTIYNLVGLGAPLLVALVCTPLLLSSLGTERFGLLSLIWAVTSYFGLLDFGLGRVLTQAIARCNGQPSDPAFVGHAMVILAGVGLLGTGLMLCLAPQAVALLHGVADVDATVAALNCMALAVPFVVLTSGMRGVLEGHRAFGWVNLIRLPLGLWTFVGPSLACLIWGADLRAIAALLLAGRAMAFLAHAWAVRHVAPETLRWPRLQRAPMAELLRAGGWMTVGNLISPFMGMADRFVVGAWVSASAVSWYSTAQELVARLWIVPGALTAALFPAFSAVSGPQRSDELLALFGDALHALVAVMLPLTAVLALFADELLAAWLGDAFARQAAPLLRLFALAGFVNCLAHIPFTLLQGVGDARGPALLYCVELPLLLVGLWLVVPKFGAIGAAWLWLGRIALDTLALFVLAQARQQWRTRWWFRSAHALQGLGAAVAFGGLACGGVVARLACLLAGSLIALQPCLKWRKPSMMGAR